MNYQSYKRIRDAAWRFLIENNISRLPISFYDICLRNNIGLYKDADSGYFSDDERGVTFIKDGRYNILVNGADTLQVQRYTMGHELGHIFLGHLSDGKLHTRISGTRAYPKTQIEYEAERFAMGILAPACVLHGLELHSAERIASVCNISTEDARIRADRIRDLNRRNAFFKSSLETQVFEQFRSYISDNV